MTALGDRLVILIIAVTGIAGLFAFWSGFIEGMVEGWLKWALRAAMILLFLLLIGFVWYRSRLTTESNN